MGFFLHNWSPRVTVKKDRTPVLFQQLSEIYSKNIRDGFHLSTDKTCFIWGERAFDFRLPLLNVLFPLFRLKSGNTVITDHYWNCITFLEDTEITLVYYKKPLFLDFELRGIENGLALRLLTQPGHYSKTSTRYLITETLKDIHL